MASGVARSLVNEGKRRVEGLSQEDVDDSTTSLQEARSLLAVAVHTLITQNDDQTRSELAELGVQIEMIREVQMSGKEEHAELSRLSKALQSLVQQSSDRLLDLSSEAHVLIGYRLEATGGALSIPQTELDKANSQAIVDPEHNEPTAERASSSISQEQQALPGHHGPQLESAAGMKHLRLVDSMESVESPTFEPPPNDDLGFRESDVQQQQVPSSGSIGAVRQAYSRFRSSIPMTELYDLQQEVALNISRFPDASSWPLRDSQLLATFFELPVTYGRFVQDSIKLLLSSTRNAKDMKPIAEALKEAVDVVVLCNRESELYSKSNIYDGVVVIYACMFDLTRLWVERQKESTLKKWVTAASWKSKLRQQCSELSKATLAVHREITHLHRHDKRGSSSAAADTRAEHGEVSRTFEEQKEILRALQEELRRMEMVNEQQWVLRMLLRLQTQLEIQRDYVG